MESVLARQDSCFFASQKLPKANRTDIRFFRWVFAATDCHQLEVVDRLISRTSSVFSLRAVDSCQETNEPRHAEEKDGDKDNCQNARQAKLNRVDQPHGNKQDANSRFMGLGEGTEPDGG